MGFLKTKMKKKRQIHRYANIIVNHINDYETPEAFFLKSENNIQNYYKIIQKYIIVFNELIIQNSHMEKQLIQLLFVDNLVFHINFLYKIFKTQINNTMLLLLLLSCFSHVRLCATPQMAAHQTPPSLGFSRQEYWSGLPFPPIHESEK